MTSNRPYLIRAVYDWIVDNNLTPHLLVRTDIPSVTVPSRYIEDNKIILNVAPQAVSKLKLGNEMFSFNARFSGRDECLEFPVAAVYAIYAKENGQGMMFAEDEAGDGSGEESQLDESTQNRTQKPILKVIK